MNANESSCIALTHSRAPSPRPLLARANVMLLLRAARLPRCALRGRVRALASAVPPANARMRLKEAADARGLTLTFTDAAAGGPPHAPLFRATARVSDAADATVLSGGGAGGSKRAAQEAAAAAALARWATLLPPTTAEREALAVVGDAALDALLVLLAHGRGLPAPRIDALRQNLLCNAALGEGAAGRAVATTAEAAVGAALLESGGGAEVTRLLLAAVRAAAPKLAQAMEDAVRSAT